MAEAVAAGLARLKAEMELPSEHPPGAMADAQQAATAPDPFSATRVDRRDLELITIDPIGSTDLDQAVAIQRRGDGYRVHYAIADVASFVRPGGPLDQSTLERGVTLYAPDERIPLHPPVLSEHAASLLEGQDRRAVLWQLDLDAAGVLVSADARRATVRSRAQLDYSEVQSRIDEGRASECEQLIAEVGPLREEIERDRGGISLNLPDQQVRLTEEGVDLHYDETLPIEGWNAQISLLTGIAAAEIMVESGVGLLRTLPPIQARTLAEIRAAAIHLGIDWPGDESYAATVSALDPTRADHAALLSHAVRAFRGAGYLAFADEHPTEAVHGALATTYAHVTAPLRRLCDRHATECVLAACAGDTPPDWARQALPELPEIMGRARRREGQLERSVADLAEAVILTPEVGRTFEAMVTSADERRSDVTLLDPAVITRIDTVGLTPGTTVRLRLDSVDLEARSLDFSVAEAP